MLEKIKSYATAPSTYVILAIGGILTLAVSPIYKILRPVAKAIPGSKA
jgi:hypothetical protein